MRSQLGPTQTKGEETYHCGGTEVAMCDITLISITVSNPRMLGLAKCNAEGCYYNCTEHQDLTWLAFWPESVT